MTKLTIVACALILGSLSGACGSSGSDDDDGGEAGSGGTDSGSGGSSASGGSSGSTGKGGSSGSGTGGSSGSGGSAGAGKGGSGGSSAGSGGSSAGSGGSVSVPGSTPVSDIDTDAEAEAVCEQIASEVDPADLEVFTEGTCTLAGLFAEALGGGDCETVKAECEADPSQDPTTEGCTSQDFPDCDITVDEFAACMSARATVAAEAFSDITCDTDFTTIEEFEEPEECTSLQERCPEIISQE